ncbi:hypothetical protein JXM67_00180 [candidate division WOR-3 bacterium]|nr:hypothetical protein [candidate division WOR-3 bacterium]
MRWLVVLFTVMCFGAAFTALVFAALIFVLRATPKSGNLFPFLDPEGLRRSQRRWMWSFIPLGLALAAGVVLSIIHSSLSMLLGGILLVTVPAMGVLGVVFIGELARSISRTRENR